MASKRTKKSDKLGLREREVYFPSDGVCPTRRGQAKVRQYKSSCAKLWSASKLTLLALVNLKAKFINMIGKLDLFDQQNDIVELTNRFI